MTASYERRETGRSYDMARWSRGMIAVELGADWDFGSVGVGAFACRYMTGCVQREGDHAVSVLPGIRWCGVMWTRMLRGGGNDRVGTIARL